MPRKIINYTNTIIYKIVCNDLNITDLYVGSTTDFTNRKYNHKSDCNNEKSKNYNLKIYTFIRNNGGWFNWSMIEIEKWPCMDRNEAQSRERYWYDILNSTLNTNNPSMIKKYEVLNKTCEEKMNEEFIKNKEYHLSKEYEEKNKEKNKDHYIKYKEYQKEYNEKNKEKTKYKYYLKKIKEMEKNDNIPTKYIMEYKKKVNEYYELNKIKII